MFFTSNWLFDWLPFLPSSHVRRAINKYALELSFSKLPQFCHGVGTDSV